MSRAEKWIAGIVAAVIVAALSGAVAWAQDTHGRLSQLDERTDGLPELARDVRRIDRNVAVLCDRLGVRAQRGEEE